tara:strand:+ start:787 stop:1035 length:249 start_codon:yes stop_codon:yes gene_type:complete
MTYTESYEYKYMIFDETSGPKVITEALNNEGANGWLVCSTIVVGNNGTSKIVKWFVKKNIITAPDPVSSEKSKIAKLWSDEE